jgi:hypothetical protein
MSFPNIRLHWQILRLSILANALFIFAYLYGTTLISDVDIGLHDPSSGRAVHPRFARREFRTQVVQQIANSQPVCDMCHASPALCAEIGEDRMRQALSYGGTNARLKRALAKMRSGEPWVMGVIGGSGQYIYFRETDHQ